MNQDFSVWHLVVNASLTVQSVMALLFIFSLSSWFIILQRGAYFRATKRAMFLFENQFWSGVDLSQLFREGTAAAEKGTKFVGMESIFRAGFKEFSRLRQQPGIDIDAVMEGAQRAMRVANSREEEQMDKHLSSLATVGSISPYIGLFGTVWGIMTSFQGLATMHQATLATVAPGISEALVATAMGLFAAIPAVLFYNQFSSRVEIMLNKYETFTDEFYSILHRQALSIPSKPTPPVKESSPHPGNPLRDAAMQKQGRVKSPTARRSAKSAGADAGNTNRGGNSPPAKG